MQKQPNDFVRIQTSLGFLTRRLWSGGFHPSRSHCLPELPSVGPEKAFRRALFPPNRPQLHCPNRGSLWHRLGRNFHLQRRVFSIGKKCLCLISGKRTAGHCAWLKFEEQVSVLHYLGALWGVEQAVHSLRKDSAERPGLTGTVQSIAAGKWKASKSAKNYSDFGLRGRKAGVLEGTRQGPG